MRKADRNDEAFQEFLMCVALKPDWSKVKLEAQKVRKRIPKTTRSLRLMGSLSLTLFCCTLQVLSELFSSVFENEEMPTPLHPLQGGLTDRLIKPTALLRSLSPLTQRSGSSSQVRAAHIILFLVADPPNTKAASHISFPRRLCLGLGVQCDG